MEYYGNIFSAFLPENLHEKGTDWLENHQIDPLTKEDRKYEHWFFKIFWLDLVAFHVEEIGSLGTEHYIFKENPDQKNGNV
jgi:hypothetical protein